MLELTLRINEKEILIMLQFNSDKITMIEMKSKNTLCQNKQNKERFNNKSYWMKMLETNKTKP